MYVTCRLCENRYHILKYNSITYVSSTHAHRCACNGHAGRCGTDIDSVCDCLHNTEGDNCERCLPFYNDKPWRYGATNNAFPCKPCNCNNHATRCHYNVSVDPFPDSYEMGGGGVCDDCQDNTGEELCHFYCCFFACISLSQSVYLYIKPEYLSLSSWS